MGFYMSTVVHHRMIDPVSEGDAIFLSYQEPDILPPLQLKDREDIGILFCDAYIVVITKPSGMVTHPTSGHADGTLIDMFPEQKLRPVSRLDRETSGVMILARDPHVHYTLSLQHQNKTIEKEYIGFVHGIFGPCPARSTHQSKENRTVSCCAASRRMAMLQ